MRNLRNIRSKQLPRSVFLLPLAPFLIAALVQLVDGQIAKSQDAGYIYIQARVDSFAIPLSEINRRPGNEIRLAYWARSAHPDLSLNSIGYQDRNSYYAHHLPLDNYHSIKLSDRAATLDLTKVPEVRGEGLPLSASSQGSARDKKPDQKSQPDRVLPVLIPPATIPCKPEVGEWWEQLRAAADKMTAAKIRMDESVAKYKPANVPKKIMVRLVEDLDAAASEYLRLLRDGSLKSYRPPIPDFPHPRIIYRTKAQFTEDGRQNKINGVVVLNVLFRSDGYISDVRIVKGLGHGLDEQSSQAARQILYLPAIRGGDFVEVRSNLEFSFNIY